MGAITVIFITHNTCRSPYLGHQPGDNIFAKRSQSRKPWKVGFFSSFFSVQAKDELPPSPRR